MFPGFFGCEGRGLAVLIQIPRTAAWATRVILIGPPTPRSQGKDAWFGGVQSRKNDVSYHLRPACALPDLLDGLSPELKKRRQGKSCFNFKTVDKPLFKELGALTKRGYQRFKKEGLVL